MVKVKEKEFILNEENGTQSLELENYINLIKWQIRKLREIYKIDYNHLYTKNDALKSFVGSIKKQSIDFTKELTYYDRKALHNLKYYTWVEQQGKTVEQINELWNPDFWEDIFENEITYFDQLIEEFNQIVEKS